MHYRTNCRRERVIYRALLSSVFVTISMHPSEKTSRPNNRDNWSRRSLYALSAATGLFVAFSRDIHDLLDFHRKPYASKDSSTQVNVRATSQPNANGTEPPRVFHAECLDRGNKAVAVSTRLLVMEKDQAHWVFRKGIDSIVAEFSFGSQFPGSNDCNADNVASLVKASCESASHTPCTIEVHPEGQ